MGNRLVDDGGNLAAARRGKGASLMQCGFGVGFFIASFVWVFLAPLGPQAWRYMFLLGALPALLTLWIRIAIPESAMWQQASESRRIAAERQRSGAGIGAQERALTRFTMVDLFAQPDTRRLTIIVFLTSLTTTLAWWSISTWIPPHVASLATKANLHPQQWASYAAMTYNAGGIAGYALFGFFADVFGRKPVVMIFFAMSLILTPVLFLSNEDMNILLAVAALNGFFTLGQYSWMPVWLPELFPTRMRATAVAFAFNAPRFVAFVGPLLAGTLIVRFGGYGKAAVIVSAIYILGFAVTPFLPETKGRPLPT